MSTQPGQTLAACGMVAFGLAVSSSAASGLMASGLMSFGFAVMVDCFGLGIGWFGGVGLGSFQLLQILLLWVCSSRFCGSKF